MLISEDLIQYLWSKKAVDPKPLASVQGQNIEILDYGKHNLSSGPDFLYAKVKIDQVTWAGNIEMHVRTSDWLKHRHHLDKAYDNVILHVVYEHDRSVNDIPVLELKNLVAPNLLTNYTLLMDSSDHIPCGHVIGTIPHDKIHLWYHSLIMDRLDHKATNIKSLSAYAQKDYHTLMYNMIGKYYGAIQNMDSFVTLTERLPWILIEKNRHNLHNIESLVLGTAGFLELNIDDTFYNELKKTCSHLLKKYNIVPMQRVEWRTFGMHAAGNPVLRLAQFAAFMHRSSHIFDRCLDKPSLQEIRYMLHSESSSYWLNHYSLGKSSSKQRSPHATDDFKDRIIINGILPVLWIYADDIGQVSIKEYCLELLESIKSEQNSVITQWKKIGIRSRSAFDSQALIQLKHHYCDARQCLSCQIGAHILATI